MPLPLFHIYCSTLILITHEIVLPRRLNLLKLDVGTCCTGNQVSKTSFEVFQCLLGRSRVLRLLHKSLIQGSFGLSVAWLLLLVDEVLTKM